MLALTRVPHATFGTYRTGLNTGTIMDKFVVYVDTTHTMATGILYECYTTY